MWLAWRQIRDFEVMVGLRDKQLKINWCSFSKIVVFGQPISKHDFILNRSSVLHCLLMFVLMFASLCVNLIGNIVFLPHYGIIATAYTYMASALVYIIAVIYFSRDKFILAISQNWFAHYYLIIEVKYKYYQEGFYFPSKIYFLVNSVVGFSYIFYRSLV